MIPDKRAANKLEKKRAKAAGGRRTPLSGAKGGSDYSFGRKTTGAVVRVGEWQVEHKSTKAESFRLTLDDIAKGGTDAWGNGRRFAMQVEMAGVTVWVFPAAEIRQTEEGFEF